MHSGLLILMAVLLTAVWLYLGEIHRIIGYTHHRDRQLSIRGMRLAVLVCVVLIVGQLVIRHIEFINLGWS